MSNFFDWLNDYVPLAIVIIIWLIILPVRLSILMLLPSSAWRGSHFFNPVYEFFAFEERL
jgi:hypothetical protein